MLNPFIDLIATVLQLYNLALIVWVILSWLISFDIVNPNQPFVYKLNDVLSRIIEPVLRPIRKVLPDLGGIDLSPLVLFLALQFLRSALYHYFYSPTLI